MTNIPVLGMPASEMESWDGLGWTLEFDGYIPTAYYIGPDMTVLAADDLYASPSDFLQ